MANLHERFGELTLNQGFEKKQVKVRGRFRPLTEDTGRQKPTGLQQVFGFQAAGLLTGSV